MPNWVLICLGSIVIFTAGFYVGCILMVMMAAAGSADQAMERMMRDRGN